MAGLLTIPDRSRTIIADCLGVPIEKATDDASLFDDLGADSLDPVEISIALEQELGVLFTDHEIESWNTAGDVLKTVEGKRS